MTIPETQSRIALIELAAEAGLNNALVAVRTAIEAGCTDAEIQAAIMRYTRSDLTPEILRAKLMFMKPGDPVSKGLPIEAKGAAATPDDSKAYRDRLHLKSWQDAQATKLIQAMRRESKEDGEIRAALKAKGWAWP